MQIVIDVPEETYKGIMLGKWDGNGLAYYVKVGKPLPKGHGDLIDVNRKITVSTYDEEWDKKTLTVREALNRWSDEGITVTDVVIPADKTESEG